jgi:hypothetical protein
MKEKERRREQKRLREEAKVREAELEAQRAAQEREARERLAHEEEEQQRERERIRQKSMKIKHMKEPTRVVSGPRSVSLFAEKDRGKGIKRRSDVPLPSYHNAQDFGNAPKRLRKKGGEVNFHSSLYPCCPAFIFAFLVMSCLSRRPASNIATLTIFWILELWNVYRANCSPF